MVLMLKVCDDTSYPFANFNTAIVVWELLSNVIWHIIIYVIMYPCFTWDLQLIHFIKRGLTAQETNLDKLEPQGSYFHSMKCFLKWHLQNVSQLFRLRAYVAQPMH